MQTDNNRYVCLHDNNNRYVCLHDNNNPLINVI